MRIGHGYDVHKLASGRKLIIGGADIPHELGLLGHSDADVLTHAVCDSILGAAGLCDIGTHFPDTDDKFKDADSIKLLRECASLARSKGWIVSNIDATVIAQRPKLKPYIDKMSENIAKACSIDKAQVNVKATTEEGLGFTGAERGIAAHCVCLLKKS